MTNKEYEMLKPLSQKNPFLRFLGIELTEAGAGWVKMKLGFRPDFLQPFTMHGGVIYSLADAAAAHAVMTLIMPDQFVTTVEQRINFLKAVKDQDLYAESQVVNLGRTLAYVEVSLSIGDGTLVGKSTATLMRLERDRMLKTKS